VEFAKVGLHDIARSGCVVYQSDNPSVIEVSPLGVLTSHGAGSATITVQFNGLSDSVTVNAIADNDPPLLVRARGLGNRYIEVTYSEPVDNGTGADAFNYKVAGVVFVTTASVAEQLPDPTRVILTLTDPMPCEYITVTVNSVTDIAGNEIVPDSTIGFMNLTPKSMTHRYTFNEWAGNAPSGTVVHDGVGGGNGVVLGSDATFTSDRIVLPGGSSAAAAYVDLPNGLLSGNSANNSGTGEVTVEGWFRNTGARNWGRIFDFGSSLGAEVGGPGGGGEGYDYLMLSAENGTDTGTRRTELRNRDPVDAGTFTVDHATTDFNNDTHFVVTWKESTGQIITYANGAPVSSMTVPTQMSEVNDVNVWLGRSNWTADENVQGEFDEFRMYNRVLSLSEIVQNGMLGPDSEVGQPVAVYFGEPKTILLGQTIQPAILADFTTVSNVDLSLSGCVALESSDPTIIAVTPEGMLDGLMAGSATITARFSGLSGSDAFAVTTGTGPGLNEVQIALEPGPTVRVTYLGVSGTSYQLLRATSVTGPYDTVVETKVAPAGGLIEFVDPNPPSPNAFYQVLRP
jgi:hypothetical protein